MAGIRERDKRAVASFGFNGVQEPCTTFVPCSQYVLFRKKVLASASTRKNGYRPVSEPQRPGSILAWPDSIFVG
jgi:hypothetical protein